MARYMFKYVGGMMMEDEEARNREMRAWEAWFHSMGEAVVEAGAPFLPQGKRVDAAGSISDTPTAAMASGYSIVEADSLAAALEMAGKCPGLKSGSVVDVFEMMSLG